VRLFFAAWPPPETAGALAQWAGRLDGRPTPAEKIHLTLAFLGAAQPDKAAAAARRVRGRAHSLPIEVAKYWKHNQIVWAGPRETPPQLAALAAALHFELYRAEFILERRPFAAHVTLVRKARKPVSLPPLPAVDWPIRELALVSSTVSSNGSTYEVLERFPLDQA
jgi:2'-5' RNA ligase